MPRGWVGGMFIPSYIDVVEIIQKICQMGIRRSQNFAALPRILSRYLFFQRVSF